MALSPLAPPPSLLYPQLKKKAAPSILRHFTLFKRSQYTGYKGHDIYNITVNRLVSGRISSLSMSINPPFPLDTRPDWLTNSNSGVGWDCGI